MTRAGRPWHRLGAALRRRRRRPVAALAGCSSGHALLEFGLTLPILMSAGMYGLEIAYMHTTNMAVSQAIPAPRRQ